MILSLKVNFISWNNCKALNRTQVKIELTAVNSEHIDHSPGGANDDFSPSLQVGDLKKKNIIRKTNFKNIVIDSYLFRYTGATVYAHRS